MSNICSGWRATGLYPLYPNVVLDKVGDVCQSVSEGVRNDSRSGVRGVEPSSQGTEIFLKSARSQALIDVDEEPPSPPAPPA
jgi:hypothetical protein